MTFGKLIAWSEKNQRGIVEDRTGETFKIERKDFVYDLEALKVGMEVVFETWDEQRTAYAVRSTSGEFTRFHDTFGDSIS